MERCQRGLLAHLGKVMVAQAALGFESLSLRQIHGSKDNDMYKKNSLGEKFEMLKFLVMLFCCGLMMLVLLGAGARLSIAAFDAAINGVCFVFRTISQVFSC